MPTGIAPSMLDEMLMLSIEGGHTETMRRLLGAGARIDGDPDSDDIPLGHACWRGRVQMTRELIERNAALTFRDGGSAIGAALHGSRHCHEPEGGPSMRIVDEIPKEHYTEIVRILLAAGAPVPERIGENGARPLTHRNPPDGGVRRQTPAESESTLPLRCAIEEWTAVRCSSCSASASSSSSDERD